ncbi:MAG: hypothetical protein V1924_03520 [Candidatus Bathyarchaeota archaeon]
MTDTPTLEKIYNEIITIRQKLDNLEKLILPTEHITPEEADEINTLKDEATRGETIPWTQVKAKAQKLLE